MIPDLLRRAVALGLSGFFTTEEAIRRAVNDTLPRDWVDFAVDQSERTREDMIRSMAQEFGQVLQKVELNQMLEQLLEGRTIEVTAQIKLGPREGDGPGDVRTRARVGVRDGGPADPDDPGDGNPHD